MAESGDLKGALAVRDEVLRVQTALVDSALDAPLADPPKRSPLLEAPERRGKTIDMLALIDIATDGKPPQKWAMEDGVLKCLQMHLVPKVVLPYIRRRSTMFASSTPSRSCATASAC